MNGLAMLRGNGPSVRCRMETTADAATNQKTLVGWDERN